MNTKLSFSNHLVIGVMLFALFFGAGNLIFPASLGQNAGTNIWVAIIGFLITGIGLPFLGTLAIGFSGSKNLQELSSRVHPVYGDYLHLAIVLNNWAIFCNAKNRCCFI